MLRLPAALEGPLRLIGSGFGTGERLIAAWDEGDVGGRILELFSSVGDQSTPETHRGGDQAELIFKAQPVGGAFVVTLQQFGSFEVSPLIISTRRFSGRLIRRIRPTCGKVPSLGNPQ
jgi:hypothetical protein